MLKIKLIKGTVLDKEATRKKMEELGFEIFFNDVYPEKVKLKLTPEGDKRYKTNDEAVAAACTAFVEITNS